MRKLAVDVRPGDYTVVKLAPDAAVPASIWQDTAAFVSVTRTVDELSIVCPTALAPQVPSGKPGWRLLTARGPFEFSLTGIMAALAGALAQAGVALFALSTFDTDHLLVADADLPRAVAALREAGHDVHE